MLAPEFQDSKIVQSELKEDRRKAFKFVLKLQREKEKRKVKNKEIQKQEDLTKIKEWQESNT
jgi:hypothetical protein